MEINTTETKKSTIEEELPNGCTAIIFIDHYDHIKTFDIDIGTQIINDLSKADLLTIKKMINKALNIL